MHGGPPPPFLPRNRVARIANDLPDYPERSLERANVAVNLSNIRLVLARRDFSP